MSSRSAEISKTPLPSRFCSKSFSRTKADAPTSRPRARPFLRSREFWWQEGHTLHETAEEAIAETEQQLNCYADFYEKVLAIPVLRGRKTEKEKFAGADATYTVECMMKDHKALQGGTSHYFGDKFSRAYDVTFAGRDNRQQYPFQTSWGTTTRMIGAVIMAHGDNNGLVLPPQIAPIQIIVLPVAQHKPGVLEAAGALCERLQAAGLRVKMDDSDNSMGWKCAQYEMKGVPLRVEIGPRDIESGACVMVRRDNGEKTVVALEELEAKAKELLNAVHDGLFARAKQNLDEHTYEARSLEEAKALQTERGGFIKTMWCGELDCELAMKEKAGMSSRCIPFRQETLGETCACCGKSAKHMVIWGVAY
ncbi:MAG: proline--tRNA ligase [Oscillospiraceae bacterium]|nr:proline--tRNA ligase [Oscillospiraceae bacterium]